MRAHLHVCAGVGQQVTQGGRDARLKEGGGPGGVGRVGRKGGGWEDRRRVGWMSIRAEKAQRAGCVLLRSFLEPGPGARVGTGAAKNMGQDRLCSGSSRACCPNPPQGPQAAREGAHAAGGCRPDPGGRVHQRPDQVAHHLHGSICWGLKRGSASRGQGQRSCTRAPIISSQILGTRGTHTQNRNPHQLLTTKP